jgi:hypothetical protein
VFEGEYETDVEASTQSSSPVAPAITTTTTSTSVTTSSSTTKTTTTAAAAAAANASTTAIESRVVDEVIPETELNDDGSNIPTALAAETSDGFCESVNERHVAWPKTAAGTTVKMTCPNNGQGLMSFQRQTFAAVFSRRLQF